MSRLVFAFGAGLLSPANPCGFAMLPAYLGFYAAGGDAQTSRPLLVRLADGFRAGAAASAGFIAVFAAAALIISAGLRSVVRYVPWAAVVIGVLLVAVGVAVLAGRHVGLRPRDRLRPGQGNSLRATVLFGASFAAASLSCTIAVLLAVVAQALATANPLSMVAVFAAYGLGAATVLTALSLSAAVSTGGTARRLRRFLPVVTRLGGALLIVSGAYLVVYWWPVLSGGLPNETLGKITSIPSNRLRTFLDANIGLFGILAAGLVAVGTALVVRTRREHAGGVAPPPCCPDEDRQVEPQPDLLETHTP